MMRIAAIDIAGLERGVGAAPRGQGRKIDAFAVAVALAAVAVAAVAVSPAAASVAVAVSFAVAAAAVVGFAAARIHPSEFHPS